MKVRAQGLEHLGEGRPAVYVFNHQSNLDPVVVASLLRGRYTGVGKQEVARDPRGWLLSFLDVALIDRGNSEEARASVAALVDRLRGGESVLIAPEGTRMPTPKLGPFKRGAFHLAYDAQIPVVPIVLRNTGELWPRGASLITPGTVDVCVLPPVPPDGWTRDTVGAQADRVRGLFQQTLEHWPVSA